MALADAAAEASKIHHLPQVGGSHVRYGCLQNLILVHLHARALLETKIYSF